MSARRSALFEAGSRSGAAAGAPAPTSGERAEREEYGVFVTRAGQLVRAAVGVRGGAFRSARHHVFVRRAEEIGGPTATRARAAAGSAVFGARGHRGRRS